ncbi:DEAH-box ATP-dependent RNA helicase prp43 [Fusarium irregulare]|uniref:DEAH-box ATP-dependent RNA helicase prp43 n=1 Tax=Fusarium irregulare TaxID=2494466 RepID=A0A9W8PMG9_9HYPO|nr:DEAH-box ATP-dependent RNA helicase prp43 [Fusarium irregulare]
MPQSNGHAAEFDSEYETKVPKAFARGLYHNIAIRKDGHVYKTVHDNYDVLIDSYSDVALMQHPWVISNKIQNHGKAQIHTVTQVKPEWILELPLFQKEMLRQRRTGGLVQPQVKAALDAPSVVSSHNLRRESLDSALVVRHELSNHHSCFYDASHSTPDSSASSTYPLTVTEGYFLSPSALKE